MDNFTLSCVRRKINCDSRVQDIHTFHSISRVFARKRRKKFLIACLPHRFNTSLRVSLGKESYDTEWFDYNDVTSTYSTPPSHWKLKGLKRRTDHTSQLTL